MSRVGWKKNRFVIKRLQRPRSSIVIKWSDWKAIFTCNIWYQVLYTVPYTVYSLFRPNAIEHHNPAGGPYLIVGRGCYLIEWDAVVTSLNCVKWYVLVLQLYCTTASRDFRISKTCLIVNRSIKFLLHGKLSLTFFYLKLFGT